MKPKNNRRIYLSAALALAAGSASAQDAGNVNPPLFQIGSVEVRPNAAYGLTYDDNIFLANTAEESDLIHSVTPGVILGAGDYREQSEQFFSASYNANFLFFQDNSGSDSTDHQAAINFGGGDKLSWRFDQSLVTQSDSDVTNTQALGRTKRRAWTSTLSTVYDLSDKTQLESSFAYIYNDYDAPGTFDTRRGQGNILFNYSQTAKLNYGVGVAGGYDQSDGGANSVFEQLNVRLVWQASAKLALRAGGGIEFRQFQGIDLDREYLVFDFGADWKVSPLTVASFTAGRAVAPANAGVNTITARNTVGLTLANKIGERITATLVAGYLGTEGNGTAAGVAGSEDDYFYIRPGFAARLSGRSSFAVFYQYRNNSSSTPTGDFSNNQVGASLGYSF